MQVYKVQIDALRERNLYVLLNTASNGVFILGQSLQTDSDIVENCDSRNFTPYATYLIGIPFKPQSEERIVGGCIFRRNLYHVSSERKSQPAYQMQIVDDAANLPVVIRQQFAAFQLSRREVRSNFEHERQERNGIHLLGSGC